MPAGLDPETTARLIARHGTLDAAAQKARADPRFEAAFRETIGMQYLSFGVDQGPANRAASAEFWQLVATWDRLGDDVGTGKPVKPRHRPREALPHEMVRQLGRELERRRAAGNPRRGPFTQQAIADRVGVERHRVQQAEQLIAAGWDLPKSHPDFSANDGVRWPTPEEALQMRGF